MTTRSIAKSLSSARADEMAALDEMVEEDACTNDADLQAPTIERLISPAQALDDGLDIDAGGDIEQSAPEQDEINDVLANGKSRQGFRIGALRLMIRYEDASELAEMSVVHRLPNAPDWFCGISNMHGKLTPVFDLARYFCVDPDPGAKRMLLVISRGGDAAGVLIDGLPERLRCSEDEYSAASALPERLLPHLRGATLVGEQPWFDLDTHSLLDAIEQSLGQAL
jgi:twitching motility protein PilI